MLKGISPLISPELLKVLDEMGHGDEIVLADANFPSSSIGQRVIRADGIGTAELLAAILPLFPLDQYDPEHFVLMEVVPGDTVVPVIWEAYKALLNYYEPVFMDIQVGDVVTLKKQHPCGSREWEVLRIGADFRLKCAGCGHQIMIARRLVEKNLRDIKRKA